RARAEDAISGTARWLDRRPGARPLHLALDDPASVARVARFIDGSALGLVLSGGGAQGTAHLGALKALGEAGIAFDCVGGTSAGAAMGAALALGRDPDEVMRLCEEIFLRSRAMGRYTVPKFSLLDPKEFDAALRRQFGPREIEDLVLPFFAVATNLSTNDMAVLDRGPLWEAIRASTSIPGVFPPWIRGKGEVLVDGAVMDNAPLLAMRERKAGPALLLNMRRSGDWRVALRYGELPGRRAIAAHLLKGWLGTRGPGELPTVVSVLARVFNVNAQKRLRSIDAPGDVIIDIDPLEGMAILDWSRARAQYEESYRMFSEALARGGAASPDPVARLAALKQALR
ncbi:patatin-like phospholipase family protein, partial [Oceaniglobus roseus]|uniref:patatin-like phospholipase family protein n=1 Tax=Oceaniglobus roseus TaxID=1737570 RepID=UPI001562BDFB